MVIARLLTHVLPIRQLRRVSEDARGQAWPGAQRAPAAYMAGSSALGGEAVIHQV